MTQAVGDFARGYSCSKELFENHSSFNSRKTVVAVLLLAGGFNVAARVSNRGNHRTKIVQRGQGSVIRSVSELAALDHQPAWPC